MQDHTENHSVAESDRVYGACHCLLLLSTRRSVVLGVLMGCLLYSGARADLSAPDNIIYGTISLGMHQVTANDTYVRVEARRANGPAIAKYTMGARPGIGDYYALNLPVEELAPVYDPLSVLFNEPVSIVLISGQFVQGQSTVTPVERGRIYRLDFAIGSTNLPSGFGIWAQGYGLGASSQDMDADADGASNLNEYIAGTHPTNPESRFMLQIAQIQAGVQVSFTALRAEGTAYAGVGRHYVLERLADVASGVWETVPGFSDILGENQPAVHSTSLGATPLFYRAKVSLTSSGP